MTLRLVREPSVRGCTFGKLSIDGVFECHTLEDEMREQPGPVAAWKIPGVTAIPRGTYQVRLTMSARFGKLLPLVQDVPGFEGIRIHAGNVISDTDGCILVGRRRYPESLGGSVVALRQLLDKLRVVPSATLVIA